MSLWKRIDYGHRYCYSTAAANVDVIGSGLTLATKDATAITWSAVVPGATMVWTPIEPINMASSFSTDTKLELIATGEKAGLWGTTNTNLQILEQSATGYLSQSWHLEMLHLL